MSESADRPFLSGDPLIGDRHNPGPTKGSRQRRAILDGLTRLLATRPIGELTVAEIAAEVGMGRSGFYVYFDSKYSALAVMTSEAWTGLMEQTDSFVRPDGESPADYLERTGAAALQTWRAYDSVLIASIQSVPLDDQIAALWASWNTRLTDVLTAQLRRDQERGIARPAGDDVSQLVVTLHYMMQNMFYLDRLQRCDEAQTRRMFNSVKAIWLSSGWGVAPTPQ